MRTPPRALRFDVFTLDLSRYVVLRGDEELPLRPKAFDVLKYLAEHPGRVVSKEELFDAVWAGAARSDDTLVQCVKHIRKTLGDRGHRIVKAAPKRGYLFSAEVQEIAQVPATTVSEPAAVTQTAPRPASFWPVAVRPIVTGWHRQSLVVAAMVLLAGAGVWALWNRVTVRHPPHSQATHDAILGRAILDREHSAKATKEAIALFDKALTLDPDSIPALLGYARAMVVDVTDGWAPRDEHASRFSQADAAIERAIKLDPGHARAYRLRGFLWRARGDPERALEAFERAIALEPGNAWTHAEMGRAKIDVGKADEAINDIQIAIRLNPKERRLFNWYYWISMAAVHVGKSDIALEWLMKWREPNELFDRFAGPWLAVAYADTGREADARAVVAAHLARVPGFTIATFRRAFPDRNAVVAKQRKRVADALRRLGVPEGGVQTGSLK